VPRSPASIERIKLVATFMNSLAVAAISLGVFAPLIYQGTTLDVVPTEKRSLLYGVVSICVIAAVALHCCGQAVLSFLEDRKFPETTDERQ
jgi:hypothetical protein